MRPPRLAIVARTFWPLVGAAETAAARLVVGLVEAGWQVTVLTACWNKRWPTSIRFNEAIVERLSPRPEGLWSTWRFQQAVGRWLRRHAASLDVVYAFGLRHEAAVAWRAVGRTLPVVLRAQTAEPPDRHALANGARAAAVVCRCAAAHRALAEAGCPSEHVHTIDDGVTVLPPRTVATRVAARRMMADANSALRLPDWAHLAVYVGRLATGRGLEDLAAAWLPVAGRWPNARLWFVGDGPQRDPLRRQIGDLNLSGRVVPLGLFDHVEELLAAADVFVHPEPRCGPSLAVAEAMGAGLPVIAADSPGHRDTIQPDQTGLLVPPGNVAALSEALMRVFNAPPAADRLGRAARQYAAGRFALAQMVDRHVTLFQALPFLGAGRDSVVGTRRVPSLKTRDVCT